MQWLCFPALALSVIAAQAETRSITMTPNGAAPITVGSITFSATDDGRTTYAITWDDSRFSDNFLSMRPFKCLDGPDKQWCRVPYPYEIKRRIDGADKTDLEYDLLFIWKRIGEYGIDMWNGVYYKFDPAEIAPGTPLVGRLHEMNMDILSAPPDDGNLRPIREVDLEPGESDSHWLPVLRIE